MFPFFSGIPVTAAIAHTSVTIKSGAQARLTGMIHAVVLLLSMPVLVPVMSQIPMPALVGVLIVTAQCMSEWRTVKELFIHRYWSAVLLFVLTVICIVTFDLNITIIIRIIGGCIFFAVKSVAIATSLKAINR